ncbi:MAG: sensor histidine kinase [Acidimicrobiia bacterium]
MTTTIEPGLLNLFRWYVGIRLGFLAVVVIGVNSDDPPSPPQFPGVGVALFGVLLVFLLVPWFAKATGRWFLPIAITLATVAPLGDAARTISGRLAAGSSPNDALADYWVLFFLLFVPFILIAWQYRYRWVVVFAIAASLAQLMMIASVFTAYEERLVAYNLDLEIVAIVVIGQGFLFAFVGFFVTKLMARQREATEELRLLTATTERLATERERTRLAREMHDTLAHTLTGTVVQLEAAEALWDTDETRAREHLERALADTRSGLAEARRAIENLRASPVENLGLGGALEWLAQDTTARSGITTTASVTVRDTSVSPTTEHTVYRIVEEAVANAVRHAAASHIAISAHIGDEIAVTVTDDGSGFDPGAVPAEGHHGLVGMLERASLAGGELTIDRSDSGGTAVRFVVASGGR